MEELNTISATAPQAEKKERKPYTPPTADIILLVPKEELSAWDYTYHGGNRWAMNSWNSFEHDAASGGVSGAVYGPTDDDGNTWTLPTK